MSSSCVFCGKKSFTSIWIDEHGCYETVCSECMTKREHIKIEKELQKINCASDFKSWKKEDMSEAFWMHLIEYQKRPNKRSLSIMRTAYLWACHDDHGLSNSFYNALNWCGIDFFVEQKRTDIPEE